MKRQLKWQDVGEETIVKCRASKAHAQKARVTINSQICITKASRSGMQEMDAIGLLKHVGNLKKVVADNSIDVDVDVRKELARHLRV